MARGDAVWATENQALKDALQQVAQGDQRAFKTIYETTFSRFHVIIANLVGDKETARDILQSAYVSIWKNAASYDPTRAEPFTWMLVIMRNRALDQLRSRARAPVAVELSQELEDASRSPESWANIARLSDLLEQYLAKLPEDMARCIRLNVIHGLTCREIGELLDISANTVKSWVNRGLKRLREDVPGDLQGAFLT